MANLFRRLELDLRLISMIVALAIIWIGFDLLTDGGFITPRNLWNISVQSASVAVMATGMVLIIVTRNIDLSVGSILGFTGMVIGVTQTQLLPSLWGFDHPLTWIVTVICGLAVGAAIGALHGVVVAYLGVSSFIVTLAGLLIWRGAAWWTTAGQTVAPLDAYFKPIGGGIEGAIGASASWGIGIAASLLALVIQASVRRQRLKFGFAVRPLWAEMLVSLLILGAILGATAVVNAYPLPPGVVRKIQLAAGAPEDAPLPFVAYGFAIPVLIAVSVGFAMTFLADRTRFGRYVFAIGGNPEAAVLSGINTRLVLTKVFALMGCLAGVSACITTARLQSATNATGTLDELLTIASAVIGGTSLAGGMGSIYGGMLGAIVMQSLQSGMVLLGLDAPLQNIVVGVVLVAAVWLDTVYRRHVK
jgi:D-xylose transport system permease protein